MSDTWFDGKRIYKYASASYPVYEIRNSGCRIQEVRQVDESTVETKTSICPPSAIAGFVMSRLDRCANRMTVRCEVVPEGHQVARILISGNTRLLGGERAGMALK
jgi:hypothetical protein